MARPHKVWGCGVSSVTGKNRPEHSHFNPLVLWASGPLSPGFRVSVASSQAHVFTDISPENGRDSTPPAFAQRTSLSIGKLPGSGPVGVQSVSEKNRLPVIPNSINEQSMAPVPCETRGDSKFSSRRIPHVNRPNLGLVPWKVDFLSVGAAGMESHLVRFWTRY